MKVYIINFNLLKKEFKLSATQLWLTWVIGHNNYIDRDKVTFI